MSPHWLSYAEWSALKSHTCLQQKHAAGCIHIFLCAQMQTHTLNNIIKVKEAINSGNMRGLEGGCKKLERGKRRSDVILFQFRTFLKINNILKKEKL